MIPMIIRAYILEVLEGELNALEGELNALEDQEATDHNAALHRVLLRLSADLALLEKEEVPPLFVPKKVKARGKRPATVRMRSGLYERRQDKTQRTNLKSS
jgi:hypothetical protein